jgi:5-methyltetrahydrofolate--homocysteine methyltransferase
MSRTERIAALKAAAAQRILMLDGAWGVMIQRLELSEEDFRGERFKDHPLPQKGNNDILILSRPEAVAGLHDQYYAAGADISETNTFSATRIGMADYGLEDSVRDLNLEGAADRARGGGRLDGQGAGKPRFVAGRHGADQPDAVHQPGRERSGRAGGDLGRDVRRLSEQAAALHEGGVDLFLVETIFDTLNAKAAIKAILDLEDEGYEPLPLWISGTITDRSGARCPARRWRPSGTR